MRTSFLRTLGVLAFLIAGLAAIPLARGDAETAGKIMLGGVCALAVACILIPPILLSFGAPEPYDLEDGSDDGR